MRQELAGHFDFDVSAFWADYTIGHFESTVDWTEHGIKRTEKGRSWNAHTAVIRELSEQMTMHTKEESQAERADENREFMTKSPAQRTTRGGVLSERLAQAYMTRFEAFLTTLMGGWVA